MKETFYTLGPMIARILLSIGEKFIPNRRPLTRLIMVGYIKYSSIWQKVKSPLKTPLSASQKPFPTTSDTWSNRTTSKESCPLFGYKKRP
jgi:hypothetical protein